MTLRKSFCNFKMIRNAVAECKHIMILHFIVLFLATTLPAIILNGERYYNKTDMLAFLSGANVIIMFVAALTSFVVSGIMFSFLYSSNSVVFYHSMPYKRGTLYLARTLGGIISLLLPVVLIFLVNSTAYFMMGINAENGYTEILNGAALVLGVYISAFAVSGFAAVLSGNRFAQCIIIAFVFFALPLSLLIISANVEQWFFTYNMEMNISYKYVIPPAMILENLVSREGTNFIGEAVYCLVYSAVFLLLGGICYKHRKSENTNKFFAFGFVNVFLKYYITTFVSLTFGMVLLAATEGDNVFLSCLLYILFAFAAYIILQAIFEKNYKSMFKNMKYFAVYAVVLALLLIVPLADVFKVEGKPCDVAEKEKLAVRVRGDLLEFKTEENILKANTHLAKAWESNRENYRRDDIYSQDTDNVSIELQRGPLFSLTRNFHHVNSDITEAFYADVYNSREVKEQLSPRFKPDEYKMVEIQKWSSVLIGEETPGYQKTIRDIVNALKNDIMKYTYEDINASYAIAHIALTGQKDYSLSYYTVYSCYSETLKVIDKYFTSEWDAENIEKIVLFDARKGAEGLQERGPYTVTDKQMIDEILKRTTTKYHGKEGFDVVVDEYYHIGYIPLRDIEDIVPDIKYTVQN